MVAGQTSKFGCRPAGVLISGPVWGVISGQSIFSMAPCWQLRKLASLALSWRRLHAIQIRNQEF